MKASAAAAKEALLHAVSLDLEQMQRCREKEMVQMELDMVHNLQPFAEKCRDFVFKRKACQTAGRLRAGVALAPELEEIEK